MGYLELPQTRCADNIAEACYKCVCLIARSIVNQKKEFNIVVACIDPKNNWYNRIMGQQSHIRC